MEPVIGDEESQPVLEALIRERPDLRSLRAAIDRGRWRKEPCLRALDRDRQCADCRFVALKRCQTHDLNGPIGGLWRIDFGALVSLRYQPDAVPWIWSAVCFH